jgi:hypothetical protein
VFHDKNFASILCVNSHMHWPRARVIWSHILCPLCVHYITLCTVVCRRRLVSAAGGQHSAKPQKFRFIDQVTTANVLHIHGKYAQNSRKAIIIIYTPRRALSLCTWHTGVCNKYTCSSRLRLPIGAFWPLRKHTLGLIIQYPISRCLLSASKACVA